MIQKTETEWKGLQYKYINELVNHSEGWLDN